MSYVFLPGSAEAAPTYMALVGKVPIWNGKLRTQISGEDLEDMLGFCMREGRRIGAEDRRLGRPVRINPFHPQFLHGMPHLYFRTFYELGRKDLKGRRSKTAGLKAA